MLDTGCWEKKTRFLIDIQYPETRIQYLCPMSLRLLFMAMKGETQKHYLKSYKEMPTATAASRLARIIGEIF